jgi:hypothetical protein
MSGRNARLLRQFTYLSARNRRSYQQIKSYYDSLPSDQREAARDMYIDRVTMMKRMTNLVLK